jgi:hypothetical protein
MFGAPEESDVCLGENTIITSPYSNEEIRKLVFQMEHNKVSCPDGFPAEFFQSFWDIIKEDLVELFVKLHVGQIYLFHINFGEIILLPKVNDAEWIQQFRPICLLNVCFKIFTKVATIRLNSAADHVVCSTRLLS